jgi:4-hydroxy-tetrahydrodipicolinate reductase
MQIGLLGYGKMGRAIEHIVLQQGMGIAWRIGSQNAHELSPTLLRQADVVIEFSRPELAFAHVMACIEAGVPVVCGTTGWLEHLETAQQACQTQGGAMIWASNFSIGVNLFFAINEYVAQLMRSRPEYTAHLSETHHIHKLDAPSGTAVSLAQQVITAHEGYKDWVLLPSAIAEGQLPIMAIREGEVPGTHLLRWTGPNDEITLEHRAHSRQGFAAGAVLAAHWLANKKGVFTMRDVLLGPQVASSH